MCGESLQFDAIGKMWKFGVAFCFMVVFGSGRSGTKDKGDMPGSGRASHLGAFFFDDFCQ